MRCILCFGSHLCLMSKLLPVSTSGFEGIETVSFITEINSTQTSFVCSDLYPVLMRLLQFHLSATSASDSSSKFGHEHGAAVMSLLKEAMLASDTQMKRSAEQTVANIAQRAVVTIYYEHLSGFNQFLHLCLKKWMNQLARAEDVTVRVQVLIQETSVKYSGLLRFCLVF